MRKDRIPQALPSTRLIYRRNAYHAVFYVESTRTGKPYQVILDWTKPNGVLTLKAELWSYDVKEQPHPANQNKTVCYQCLAAAKKMAKEAGKVLSFCKSYEAAKNLLRLGGELVKVTNPGGGVVWATVR